MSVDFTEEQIQIRDAVERLCARYGDEYWLARDMDKQFPEDFCQAIADAGLPLHALSSRRASLDGLFLGEAAS